MVINSPNKHGYKHFYYYKTWLILTSYQVSNISNIFIDSLFERTAKMKT